MKNIYFFIFFLIFSDSLLSQRTVKLGMLPPNGGLMNKTANRINTSPQSSDKNIKETNSVFSASSASIVSKSTMAYCNINSHNQPLQYNKDLNLLTFFVNKSGTYNSASNSNKGNIICYFSLNDGATWDSTLIYSDAKYNGMLTGGAVYNPMGNTNPLNGYLVSAAPLNNDTDWVGNFYVSKPITIPGNNANSSDVQTILNKNMPLGSLKKHHFSYSDFSVTEDGIAHVLGELLNDPMAITNSFYGYRGAAVIKGTYVAGTFVWANDSLIPNTKLRSDGSKYLYHQSMMAWNNTGTVGYVVFYGIEAGAVNENNTFQPIIYKTTNSGSSWSKLPKLCFNSYSSAGPAGCQMGGVQLNNIEAVATNSNLTKPFFSMNEGADITVDNNDQLHIFANIHSAASDHSDSLDYIYAYTSEKYSFKGKPNGYITLWDIRTLSNGYGIIKIDSMGTEGPSGVLTAPGYTSAAWDDGSGGKLSTNARLQLSRSYDGTKLFYSWTESDTAIVGSKWNIYPDINLKGMDLLNNKITPRFNITGGVINADQQAYFHYMAPIVKNLTANSWRIPVVYSTNSFSLTASLPVSNYFLNGIDFTSVSFSLNTTFGSCITTTDIKENTESISANVYPNPVTNVLTIAHTSNELNNASIEIMNPAGQTVLRSIYKSEIDVSDLPQGYYILKIISTDKRQFHSKFLKE